MKAVLQRFLIVLNIVLASALPTWAEENVVGAGAQSKDKVTTTVGASKAPDLKVQTAPPAAAMTQRPGYDVLGVDLNPIRDVSFVQCQGACSADSNCVAVSYRDDLQRCYPKSEASILVKNAKSDVAVKSALAKKLQTSNFEIKPQVDVVGADYFDNKTDNTAACLELCNTDKKCKAFAYATKNKTCYLKSSATDFVEAPAVVSGVR